MSFLLKVECYAGYKADQRPVRFAFAPDSTRQAVGHDARHRTYNVLEILDQWYGEGYDCFKVRADDDHVYILRHHTEADIWTLDSFRRALK